MSLRFGCLSLALFFAAAAASPCTAQSRSFTGKVIDENGTPVAGARVEAKSTEGAAASTTDAAGKFSLSLTEHGSYRLRVEAVGFFLFTSETEIAEARTLEIRLNHQKELAQSVDVKYAAPALDPHQTSDAKQLTGQEILNIPYPASADFRAALPLFPGAVLDNTGQVHFNGGDVRQTNYRLNGFDISNPATGALGVRLNVDAVQTLEWQPSRFSPENGKGSAGTLDVRTEMGDNHWTLSGTNFIPGFGSRDGFHLDRWNPRIKVSGPLAKGHAWFHNSLDAHYTLDVVSDLPKGQNRTNALNGSNLTRFQWNLTDRQILTGSYLVNVGEARHQGLSFLNPLATTLNNHNSLYMGALKDQIQIGGGLLEFGFAETTVYAKSAPLGDQPYTITPFGTRGNYFVDTTRHSRRQEFLANGFAKPLHARGTHQFQFGADAEWTALDQTQLRHEFTIVGLSGNPIRTVDFLGYPRQVRTNSEVYGYAVDRWNPREDLTLELGLRSQWDRYSQGAPPAPRLAAAYAPKWLNGVKISGGWGIFYDPLRLDVVALSQEQTSLTTFFNPDGTVAGSPVSSRFVLRPSQLRLPKFTLSSLSLERHLPFDFYARVNLTAREGSRGVTFLGDSPMQGSQNDYVLANIRREHYRSAEFSLRRVFASKYEWFASYTRSDAHSNAAVDYTVENPVFTRQAGGPLPWDAPNRFLMWGWAPVQKGLFPAFIQKLIGEMSISGQIDYRTGFPFSALTEAGTLVGAPNSYRYPDFLTMNVALERKFTFRRYLWAWRVGLVNGLDRLNPNVVNNDYNSPQFMQYGRGQSRAVDVRLRFLGRI